jgi:hypothetical protein
MISIVSHTDNLNFAQPTLPTNDEKYCVISNSDFILKQKTRTPTLLTDFDPVLFKFNPVATGAMGSPHISIHATANE